MSNSSALPNPDVYLNHLPPNLAFAWEVARDVYLVTCGVSSHLYTSPVHSTILSIGIDMGHFIFDSEGPEGFPAVQHRSPSIRALQVRMITP